MNNGLRDLDDRLDKVMPEESSYEKIERLKDEVNALKATSKREAVCSFILSGVIFFWVGYLAASFM